MLYLKEVIVIYSIINMHALLKIIPERGLVAMLYLAFFRVYCGGRVLAHVLFMPKPKSELVHFGIKIQTVASAL